MGQQQPSEYYNEYYRNPRTKFQLRRARWYALWRLGAQLVTARGARTVVDVGCGPGAFARLLPAGVRYVGYDFAEAALTRAREEFDGKCKARFVLKDLNTFDGSEFAAVDAVVVCELLEHIDADVELLRKIPKGTFVYFTVPDFDLPQHVRHFLTPAAVRERYGPLVRVTEIRRVRRRHFAVWGTRR